MRYSALRTLGCCTACTVRWVARRCYDMLPMPCFAERFSLLLCTAADTLLSIYHACDCIALLPIHCVAILSPALRCCRSAALQFGTPHCHALLALLYFAILSIHCAAGLAIPSLALRFVGLQPLLCVSLLHNAIRCWPCDAVPSFCDALPCCTMQPIRCPACLSVAMTCSRCAAIQYPTWQCFTVQATLLIFFFVTSIASNTDESSA